MEGLIKAATELDVALQAELSTQEFLLRIREYTSTEALSEWQICAWVIESDVDWLADEDTAYTQLVPFPRGGQNASRVEVLATALANDVVTIRASHLDVIRGSIDETLSEYVSPQAGAARVIALRT